MVGRRVSNAATQGRYHLLLILPLGPDTGTNWLCLRTGC